MLFSSCDVHKASLVVVAGRGGCSSLVVLWGFLSCCSRVLLSNCGGVGSSCKTYGGVSVGLGLALSCDGELSDPLELLQENQVSS